MTALYTGRRFSSELGRFRLSVCCLVAIIKMRDISHETDHCCAPGTVATKLCGDLKRTLDNVRRASTIGFSVT